LSQACRLPGYRSRLPARLTIHDPMTGYRPSNDGSSFSSWYIEPFTTVCAFSRDHRGPSPEFYIGALARKERLLDETVPHLGLIEITRQQILMAGEHFPQYWQDPLVRQHHLPRGSNKVMASGLMYLPNSSASSHSHGYSLNMNSIAFIIQVYELFDIRIEPDVLDVNVFSLYPCLTCLHRAYILP